MVNGRLWEQNHFITSRRIPSNQTFPCEAFLVSQMDLGYVPAMKIWMLFPLLVVLAACGSAAQAPARFSQHSMDSPAAAQDAKAMMEGEVMVESADAAAPTPAPAAAAAAAAMTPAAMAAPAMSEDSGSTDQLLGGDPASFLQEVQVSVAAQKRIIVRTVHMSLVASDVSQAVDQIGSVARELGGWVVTTDRSSRHYGFVSIRVPAQVLDEAVVRLRRLAVEVVSESSTSDDVTDEYVDSQSLLKTLRATEESMLQLMQQTATVEEALDVRKELAEVQAEIDVLLGRIKFLEQTSAFSKINVELSPAPAGMTVDAGPDQTFSVGQAARFRAHFMPPEGIEDFTFIWDFGDGTGPLFGSGSAPTTEPGQRVTATVNHVYADDRDSPYIVQLEMTGTGPTGLVEGEDTLIATVTKIPSLAVFAGESRVVEEGKEEQYSGSFTRPEGLWDIQYRWTFGDGSATVTDSPEEGVTKAVATHTYVDYRPQSYTVTLTVTAQSSAGPVEDSSSFSVRVIESSGLIVAGWSAGSTAKTATRTLSAVVQTAGTLLIWLAIFTPVWLVLGGIAYGFVRLRRYWRRRNDFYGGRPQSPEPEPAPETALSDEPQQA